MPRRRSLSASRTVTSTVNFVGRIGASLRISSRMRRFDSSDSAAPPPPPSSWRSRLDRSKSTVSSPRAFSTSFDSTDSVVDAAAGDLEVVEYQTRAVVKSHRYYAASAPNSCSGTPQMSRRRYLKEGVVQLTSLSTLITHHRYLFLFNDLLLVSKQKGDNSYKLKQKVALNRLWISNNNGSTSFVIGWPPRENYVAHFSSETEKNDWFAKLTDCLHTGYKPKSTTVPIAIKVEGRQQIIRKEITNSQSASELLAELIRELDLHLGEGPIYELAFDTGANSVLSLHGCESVYSIVMDYVSKFKLSETQMAHLDTCPLVHCRFVLRDASTRPNTAINIMSQMLRVLSRSESKRLFGRELEGSMPPQPVLTMIDHLMIHACDVEGILRKSPKQVTVKMLRTQLDSGQVPDFHLHNVHVTASLLKEYLRSIPGQLLLAGNYKLWMEVHDEQDFDTRLQMCRNLLRLLPQCHTVLLRSVLRLLRKIANNEAATKMNTRSLGVCIAPSFLENPNVVESVTKVPELATYLIENATTLFEGFDEDGNAPLITSDHCTSSSQPLRLHQSTDSGLSSDDPVELVMRPSISPDSALFGSPISEDSADDSEASPKIEEIETLTSPEPSRERTPVLSRENSDAYSFPHRYHWRSHLSAEAFSGSRLTRQEAFRQVVSTQSSVSSQDIDDTPRGLDDEIRVLRLPANPSNASLPNVDDLRVSDIIISHRKKGSTDSTKTLIGRTDGSTAKTTHVTPVFHSGPHSTKDSPPRMRRPLLSRFDTLGLPHGHHRSADPPEASASADVVHGSPFSFSNRLSAGKNQALPKFASQNSLDRRQVPYRPPPRPAEEITLDPTLKDVPWSVSERRARFQAVDDKPALIDTVYATLDAFKKQQTVTSQR